MRVYFAVLVALFLLPLAGGIGYAVGYDPRPPQPDWIYFPRKGPATTGQEGVVVWCQAKTNSLPFAQHEYAVPGDVVVQTCRAVRQLLIPPDVKQKP